MEGLSGITFRERTVYFDGVLVLADLHVGRGASSNVELPVGDGRDMVERLSALCDRFEPETVVVAGDLLHSFRTVPGPVEGTLRGLSQAASSAGAEMVVTPGNHDTLLDALWQGRSEMEFHHGDTLICHGHVEPETEAKRYLVGHDHPTVTIEGKRHPCLLVGENQYRDADVFVMPSFNHLVPGVPIDDMRTDDFMSPLISDAGALEPVVWDADAGEALRFPPLGEFRHRL